MWRRILTGLLLCCSNLIYCQHRSEHGLPERVMEIIEEMAENGEVEDEETMSGIIEFFRNMLSDPMDINLAGREDLKKLIFLNDFHISAILNYRKEYGNLISINELYHIPGISRELADLIAPFLSVGTEGRKKKIIPALLLKEGRIQVLMRGKLLPEKREGFTPVTEEEFARHPDCRYLGPPGQLYAQVKYEFSDMLKLGITMEKDQGEKGIDYFSVSFALYPSGVVRRLVAGNFCARFGQGLVLWNSFPVNTYSQPSSVYKSEMGITPFNSTDESRAFSGAGITLMAGRVDISFMVSRRGYDARVTEDGFTSLLTTGLHNTTTTLSRRKNLEGSVLATNLSWCGNKFKISQTTLVYRYDLPYCGSDSLRKAREGCPGRWGGNAGISWYGVCGRTRLFGEVALDHGKSVAMIAGVTCIHGSKMESSLLLRNYQEYYWAPFSGAVTAGSSPRDEKGIRVAFSALLGNYAKTTLSAEFLKDYRKLTCTIDFKPEKGVSHGLYIVDRMDKTSFRYNLGFRLSSSFTFAFRGDLAISREEKSSKGYQLYSELIYKPVSKIIDGSLRFAYYNIPDWDVRIYTYERDLLYSFSLPVNYGRGLKYYVNLHFPLFRSTDVWLKLSQNRYLDRNTIGEGKERIDGSAKSEIKIQVRFRF
jgi:hypothetical protein